jgi:hypothetical protein
MKQKVIPIIFDGWDNDDPGDIQFYDVEFTADFGPWRKGETVDCLFISMTTGEVKQFDEDGMVVRETTVRFVAGEHY